MKVRVKVVDAFTDHPFAGNPAGVVTQASGLAEDAMQNIAAELRHSETAFVLSPTRPDAGVRIRYFTPKAEVPLCGHATIAAFHALAEENRLRLEGEVTRVYNETEAGILPVELWSKEGALQRVMTALDPATWSDAPFDVDALARLVGLERRYLARALPVLRAEPGGRIVMPVTGLDALSSLRPDFEALSQYGASQGIHGICLFCLETYDAACNFHSRYFAPMIGVNEDPVTGTANGLLGAYLVEQGGVETTVPVTYLVGEQGNLIGRPGKVMIEVDLQEGRITDIRIGGSAVTILAGDLVIPD